MNHHEIDVIRAIQRCNFAAWARSFPQGDELADLGWRHFGYPEDNLAACKSKAQTAIFPGFTVYRVINRMR